MPPMLKKVATGLGLVALALVVQRELPPMRRELKIMRM
jgi:hypothetical protein